MSRKTTLEEEINLFLEKWDYEQNVSFFDDIIPLLELYNVDEDNDWVKDVVGDEDVRTVRLIRTVYLVSKLAQKHSGMLSVINIRFKDLWKRMENHVR